MARFLSNGLVGAIIALALAPSSAIAQNADNTIVVTGRTPETTARFVQQMAIAADSADRADVRVDEVQNASSTNLSARSAVVH